MSREQVRRPEIVVDLGAIRRNVERLRDLVAPDGSDVMVVVKADGYGHGMLESAYAARQAGAPWLGVATIEEAVRLREAGDTGRVLCWLTVPGDDWAAAIDRDVDVTAYTLAELDEIRAAVTGTPARLQLKIDTGLSRGGSTAALWPELVAAARAGEADGVWRVTGIWSHFACSDEPAHPANDAQERAFREALSGAADAGLRPEVRHLANSGRRPPPAQQPLRPGPLRHRGVRARPRPRRQPGRRPGAGDDGHGPAGPGQGDRQRRRRVLRPHVGRAG